MINAVLIGKECPKQDVINLASRRILRAGPARAGGIVNSIVGAL